MSSAQIELLKVVLDKGLLALVLLVLGYVAARKLERFRAESAYFNKLAERRIQAYDNVLRSLSDSMASLKRILMLCEHGRDQARAGKTYDMNFYAKEVHQQFEQLDQQMQKQMAGLASESPYISEDLYGKVCDLMEEFVEFLSSFFGNADAEDTLDRLTKLQEANGRLETAWTRLQSQAREELYAGHRHEAASASGRPESSRPRR